MQLHNILVLFLLLATMTIANGRTYLKSTKIYCEPNPKFIYNHTCNLKALNRYKAVATLEAWIVDKLHNTYGILTATNAYFDTSYLPVPFPKNSYKMVLTFYENNPVYNLGHFDIYLDFLEDNKKN